MSRGQIAWIHPFIAHSGDQWWIKKSLREGLSSSTVLFGAEMCLSLQTRCLFACGSATCPLWAVLLLLLLLLLLWDPLCFYRSQPVHPPEEPILVNMMQSPHILRPEGISAPNPDWRN